MSAKTVVRKLSLVLITVSITAGLAVYGINNSSPGSGNQTVVHSVTDGDTIVVIIKGTKEKVRLTGIDTPETVDPKRPVGCFGKEASAFTKNVLPKGTKIRLVLDVEPRDRFGRLLAYVYRDSDDLFVNAEIARQGYGQPLTIPPNVAHVDEFVQLSEEAREAKRGLWGKCPDP